MTPQHKEPQTTPEDTVNYGEMVIAFMALVPELLLHDPRTFGIRSVEPRGCGAVLGMYVFTLFYTYDNTKPLLILTLLILLLAIFAYLWASLREWRGRHIHSFYNGIPWLARLLPISEEAIKRAEPLLIVVAGWGLHRWNDPLGTFVIICGACHGFRVIATYLAMRTRVLDLNDSLTEQSVAVRAMKRRRRR